MVSSERHSPSSTALLGNADIDELRACVRLLAAGLATHRSRFGVVALESATGLLEANANGAEDSALAAIVDEALLLVRQAAHEAVAEVRAPAADMPVAGGEDLRRQYRINIHAPVTLSTADQGQRFAAELRNVSWGGALVRTADFPAVAGDTVWLYLPVGRGRDIPVQGTVLRDTGQAAEREIALRFDSIRPDDEPRFRRVLEILLAQPDEDGRRAEPRLVQRLDIEYGDTGELRATLEDISAGGLMLVVPDPLELQQSLLVALSSVDSPHTIELRARVVHQTCLPGEEVALYRVGLAFEYPSPELRERLAALIHELVLEQPGLRATATPLPPEVIA